MLSGAAATALAAEIDGAQGGGGGDAAGDVAALKVEMGSLKSTTQDMNSKLDLLISKLGP